jgi:type III pantothenate kinase
MSILTIDAGNSAVKTVLFVKGEIAEAWRLPADSDWPAILLDHIEPLGVTHVGAACVRKTSTSIVGIAESLGLPGPLFISADAPLPFEMAYHTPATLGPDRIASAAAAWVRFGSNGRPVVSVDAGTATTIEVVSADGRFLGGSIAPGLRLLTAALHDGTARLPLVALGEIPPAIGRSTKEGIQSGVLYGMLDGIDGMLRRVANELGAEPHVVLTGGWADYISPHLDHPHIVDPHLVNRGIYHVVTHAEPPAKSAIGSSSK